MKIENIWKFSVMKTGKKVDCAIAISFQPVKREHS